MLLIYCEVNLILTCSEYCVIFSGTGETKIKITVYIYKFIFIYNLYYIYKWLYVPVVTLSIQDNAKLLQQLKSGFKRTTNWNKSQIKVSTEGQDQYLDFLIDTSFQGANKRFVFSFENESDRKVHAGYYHPKVEIKDYNAMNDGKSVFDLPVKNDIRTLDNIQKVLTGQGDDYGTGCLLDYNYFREPYKIIAIDLSKQEERDSDAKVVQQLILLEI